MLSPAAKELSDKLGRKYATSKKLLPNLNHKRNYVVHYRNLKFYMQQGMQLRRIHRVIAFRQTAWLAPYINFNTERRQEAKCSFERDFFKLLNNSMFGKTMENLRQRTDVNIVSQVIQAERQISKFNCQAWRPINDVFAMIQLQKTSIYWNKPTFVGFSVLELSNC